MLTHIVDILFLLPSLKCFLKINCGCHDVTTLPMCKNALNSAAGHLVEDTFPILQLHHVQDVKWDVAGLAAAIP